MKKIIYIVVGIVFIIGLFYLSKSVEYKNFKEVSYDQIKDLDNTILFVIDEKNSKNIDTLRNYADEKDLNAKYILASSLSSKEKKELGYEDKSFVYVKKEGKEVSRLTNELDTVALSNYFKEQGVIPKELEMITIDEYEKLLNEEKFIVIIGKTGCGYCDKYKPVVNKVIGEYNINIYYIDISTFSEEDYKRLYQSTSLFDDQQWGTPTTLLFERGALVDSIGGYVDEDSVLEFLKAHGVIE